MAKAHRHPQLLLVVSAELRSHPLAKGGGTAAQVYRYIKNHTHRAAHQFSLGFGLQLVVQAAQYPAARARMVVLHKGGGAAHCFIKAALVPTLIEKATVITEHLRCDQQRTLNYPAACCGELLNLHWKPQAIAADSRHSHSCAAGPLIPRAAQR